jgi:hypothetical protein
MYGAYNASHSRPPVLLTRRSGLSVALTGILITHIQSAVTPELTLPEREGELDLNTWSSNLNALGSYLVENRERSVASRTIWRRHLLSKAPGQALKSNHSTRNKARTQEVPRSVSKPEQKGLVDPRTFIGSLHSMYIWRAASRGHTRLRHKIWRFCARALEK